MSAQIACEGGDAIFWVNNVSLQIYPQNVFSSPANQGGISAQNDGPVTAQCEYLGSLAWTVMTRCATDTVYAQAQIADSAGYVVIDAQTDWENICLNS